jgi:3-dehydroquinate synthase
VASDLLKKMVEVGVKSNSTILAIGGGILQDLVGFCCSIYNRGVSYILIPTTLLGQADSCVGGKTSINFHKKKNILGTFFPPTEIIIHTGFLNTLTELEYLSGMGEIYKFHILQNKMGEFSKAMNKSNINQTIYDSLLFKKSIIDIDEFDKGERKLLNFGHTFGHALEFTSNYEIPHGVAVIIGSLISCRISSNMGYDVPNLDLIELHANELLSNVYIDGRWFYSHSIIEACKMDKKNIDGKIVDVLLDKTPFISKIDDDVIDASLAETLKMIKRTK